MDRNALVDAFRSKRERLHGQAQKLREERDRLNDETKRHALHRDELNAQVRSLVERANAHRAKRDGTNQQVREAKGRRDEKNHEAHAKVEALQALRRERGGHGPEGASPAKLRAEIQHLEYQQQTTVLTPAKEKALIDLIGSKLKELKAREASFQEGADMKLAYEEMKAAKSAAEEAHAEVTKLANEAQAEHDAMIKLFAEADGLRKEADGAQAEFVRHKVEADRVHRAYIEDVTSIREIERVVHGILGTSPAPARGERDERGAPTAAQRAEAEDIFEKFRKGEKLSTEDLIALQKGGRL